MCRSIFRLRTLVVAGFITTIMASNALPALPDGTLLALQDYYRVQTVGSPALSPDGSSVAYVRTRILEEENRRHSEIWLATTDGSSAPIRLTSSAFDSSEPRWSADGTLLSFSSRRGRPSDSGGLASSNVWFLRMDQPAGEAFRIDGVDGTPIFSRDSTEIAFVRANPPEERLAPKYASEFEQRVVERFDGLAYDWMGFRFDRRGYLPDPRDPLASPPKEVWVVEAGGGQARRLTGLGVDASDLVWSPDGAALAFTADLHQRDEHTYERADIFVVGLDGEMRQLTNGGFNYSAPSFSPDGRYLVVRGNEGLDLVISRKQAHGAPSDLFVIPVDGSEPPRNLTVEWDLIPGAPQWSPDGRSIFFSAGIGGNTHLFRLDPRDREVEQVTKGDRRVTSVSFSSDFSHVAYTAVEPTSPGQVFAAAVNDGGRRQLTNINAWLNKVQLVQPQRMIYPSADGTSIEGWVLKPPECGAGQGPCPMILTIHGGPHGAYGNEFSFARQLLAAHGYIVLYVNPRASTGYGEEFRWATWGGWGDLDYEDLMAGVDQTIELYAVDTNRLAVTGGSYGGFMTNWVIGHTDRFAAAVAKASISNWVSDYGTADIPRTKESEFFGTPWQPESLKLLLRQSPIIYAGNVVTPTLFLHGEIDYRVPMEQAEQMYTALHKQGVASRFVRYPDSYHGGWTPWRSVHALWEELQWWKRFLGR